MKRINMFLVCFTSLVLFACNNNEEVIPLYKVSTPIPEHGSEDVSIQWGTKFSFESENSYKDGTNYEVFFDTINPPKIKYSVLGSGTVEFERTDLLANKTYYWQVNSKSKDGEIKEGIIWEFSTTNKYYHNSSSWDQEEVNEVGMKGYTYIDGNLSIYKDYISDLTPLSCVNEIKGELSIWSTSFNNLEGLGNLEKINGLYIRDNEFLTDIDELSNLQFLTGGLHIDYNKELTNLSGLDSITGEINTLYISGNPNLIKLPEILSLSDTLESVFISSNALLNLYELRNLKYVSGDFKLVLYESAKSFGLMNLEEVLGVAYFNIADTTMESFTSLSKVGGEMMIWESENLISLKGLEKLVTIGEYFTIEYNRKLKTLSGIDNLNRAGYIWIYGNNLLTEYCALYNLVLSQNISWDNFLINSKEETSYVLDDIYNNCGK